MNRIFAPLCAALLLSGCGHFRSHPPSPGGETWRGVATDADRARVRDWRSAWVTALPRATAAAPREIAAQGPLFEFDHAQPGALPAPGAYRCRIFKLGAKGTAARDFAAYPFFDCRIDREDDLLSFYKVGGSQRPVGFLFPDTDMRAIFLGVLVLGDENEPLAYGRDAMRDMAGYMERVGKDRWRLVLPSPQFESMLDVIELVPAR